MCYRSLRHIHREMSHENFCDNITAANTNDVSTSTTTLPTATVIARFDILREALTYSRRVRSLEWLLGQLETSEMAQNMCKTRRSCQGWAVLKFLREKLRSGGGGVTSDGCLLCPKGMRIKFNEEKWNVKRLLYTLCTPSEPAAPTGQLKHSTKELCDDDGDDNKEALECVNPQHMRHIQNTASVAAARRRHALYGTTAMTERLLKMHYPEFVLQRKTQTAKLFKRARVLDSLATIPGHIHAAPRNPTIQKRRLSQSSLSIRPVALRAMERRFEEIKTSA